MCSGDDIIFSPANVFVHKSSNMTHNGLVRYESNNETTLFDDKSGLSNAIDVRPNNTIQYKLNENQGTIAYDVSGNGNNGTITGASWNNDGIRVALTNLVDYSWTTAGVLTLLNIDQIYTQFVFTTAYDYDGTNYYGLGENWFVSFFEDFAGWIAVIVLVVAAGIVLTIVVKEFTGKQESI